MSTDLKLVEVFWTFQGEGANWGRRAFFVRMPFCNLACSWCDTQFNQFTKFSEDDFIAAAMSEPSRFAVITGGEPTMNKQTPRVIKILKSLGFEIAMESNGCFPVPDGVDFLTVSPKADADFQVVAEARAKMNEIKFVVDKDFEFEILTEWESFASGTNLRLTLSPEFNDLAWNVIKIENFIKGNPKWRMSLQTHKFVGLR